MVDPADVPRVLSDAPPLVREGRVVVFGSAALAFRLPNAPRTRDVDVWCEPMERGELVRALMGEVSWYRDGRIVDPERIGRFEAHAAELRARLPP